MSETKVQLNAKKVPASFSEVDICRLFLASINGYPVKVYMRLDKEYAVFDTENNDVKYGLTKMAATNPSFDFIRYLSPEESLTIFGKTE